MIVGIDISPLTNLHRHRGIGFYTKNLINALKDKDEILVKEINREVKSKIDIIHYPYFDLFFQTLPIFRKYPTVVTIHDITPLKFPKHYPPGIRGSINLFLQSLSLKNVAAIITDSQSSKKDIVEYFKIDSKKVYSIYLSTSLEFRQIKDDKVFSETKKRFELPEKFALYTGNVNWNKNILNLVEACIKADVDLYLVGKSFENKDNLNHLELRDYKEFLEKFANHPKIHVLGFVETEELVALYNLASMVLLPSFYEGFGLPILEGQICGTPVITSNISSMPEIAGDGALLVDPYKIEEIKDAIEKILRDEKLRDGLIKNGFENVKRFSWEKTAKETVEVYKKVLR